VVAGGSGTAGVVVPPNGVAAGGGVAMAGAAVVRSPGMVLGVSPVVELAAAVGRTEVTTPLLTPVEDDPEAMETLE